MQAHIVSFSPLPSSLLVLWDTDFGDSTADTCTPHGDAFVYPDTGAPDLHNFVDANGQTVDAGSQATSFVCQECDTCAD